MEGLYNDGLTMSGEANLLVEGHFNFWFYPVEVGEGQAGRWIIGVDCTVFCFFLLDALKGRLAYKKNVEDSLND